MSSKCKPIQGLGDSPSFNLKTLIVNYGIRQIPICRDVIFCYALQAKRKRSAGEEKRQMRPASQTEAGVK